MSTQSKYSLRHLAVLLIVAAAAAVVIGGTVLRSSRAQELRERAATESVPTVRLIGTSAVPASALELPGRIEAWARAPIYARVSGYLQRWNVDIGGRVQMGQTLAEIETPELDQELQQARAELERARSDAVLAQTTASRWQSLLASDSVSRQEAEERQADARARQAQVNAVQANVERLQALQRFKRLAAPFDGIVTARNTDVGSLISVGATGSPGSELFVVSDTKRLRIYVNVPQRQVASIRSGAAAQLQVPERPGQSYRATVQSLSQAINASTGGMRVQLTVDNHNGELLPGGFATVRFEDLANVGGHGLPPSALIIGKNGPHVALVDQQGRARLKRVTIARDHGQVIELGEGLATGQQVINNPPDGLTDGDPVRVASTAPTEVAR